LLEVCAGLWGGGLEFDLHLVGRVNPHFGQPVLAAVQRLKKRWPGLHYHAAADDRLVERLYGEVRAAVFPTIAEGCGLPLLEALWQGVPVVCSDLPVLRENADAGGCLWAAVNDPAAWQQALRRVLTEEATWSRLQAEAVARPLPVWSEAAAALRAALS
jgi:glycosyltransferase involved in cell wall biosynthesis